MPRRVPLSLCVLLVACAITPALATGAAGAPATRDVLVVGNNWDGTADVLDVPSYERLRRINIVPDLSQRKAEILLDPAQQAIFLFNRIEIGEGHDQLVDDLFTSKDGRTLYVSRPSLADVVAIDLATGSIVWRTHVDGYRADHMAISPDGNRLVVSASTANVADVIDTASGRMVGKFASGDSPHENNFSRDGKLIYHASIGRVYTATDAPALDATKGTRVFEIVDAQSLKVLRKINMAKKLAEFGMPGMSAAVRPMALSPDERFLYFQVSFFHGFVEYDLQRDRVTRVARLPLSNEAKQLRRDEYVLDSAHHGLAMNGDGTKLCVAGTMSNYAAIVSRKSFAYTILSLGARTYWSTSSADGRYCYVSVAGDDTLSVISYATGREIARVPVGDHPQRARTGKVSTEIFGTPPRRVSARALTLRGSPSRDRRPPYRFRLSGQLTFPRGVFGCSGVVRLDLRRGASVIATAGARLRGGVGACTYARVLAVPGGAVGARAGGSARRAHPLRLTARARFTGNGSLLPRSAAPVSLAAG